MQPKDIEDRQDIAELIRAFYEKVIPDPVIGPFFTSVVHFNWDEHIPVMISFWETILLGAGTYRGNPMIKHLELNSLSPMKPEHFERWLALWVTTVKERHEGEKAEEAIVRAQSIATLMLGRISLYRKEKE